MLFHLKIFYYLAFGVALAGLTSCASSSDNSASTIGRSAVNVVQETQLENGRKYTLGPQFEIKLSEMISSEAVALGVKENVPLELNHQVLLNIDYFLNDARSFMTKGLSRGSKYIPMMKAIFRQKGLPEDLVYMALIESGFKTSAGSPASAVGPWQFILPTGRSFGLTINQWVDERRDPVKSTYAAADYLTTLHDIFKSWPLAIAAYNSGEGKILRGLKNYDTTNFWDMSDVGGHLAAETKLYVPSFLAATFIAKDPTAYGLQIETQAPDQWDDVVVPQPVTLKVAAKYSGSTEAHLKELNPHLIKGATPPKETNFILRIPAGSTNLFIAAYAKGGKGVALPVSAITPQDGTQTTPRLTTINHKVRDGEALGTIAKRYGVTTVAIRESNNLKSETIKRDQILIIPSNLPLTATRTPSHSQVMVRETVAKPRSKGTHTVVAGENLGGIAQHYDMSVRELVDINRLKGTTIKVGQKLLVHPSSAKTSPSKAPPWVSNSGSSSVAAVATKPMIHVVRSGESLGLIAQKYKMSTKKLVALNNLTNSNIRIGQKLKIKAQPSHRTQSQLQAPPPSGVHVVKTGESLSLIAQKYNITTKELQTLNNLTNSNIRIGQKLTVTRPATYKVQLGDTLYSISHKYKIPQKRLKELNGLSNNTVRLGQKLKLR